MLPLTYLILYSYGVKNTVLKGDAINILDLLMIRASVVFLHLTMLEWMVPRLLLWGTRGAGTLRLSEWERSVAELGLTSGAAEENVGEGLVDEERTSPGEDREAMERGQEMDRLMGPGSVGEAEGTGLLLSDLTGCFQPIRPGKAT